MSEELKKGTTKLKAEARELFKVLSIIALKTFFIMLLWNDIMNYLFDFPKIGYWQSLGLLVLVGLLFKKSDYNILKELKKK